MADDLNEVVEEIVSDAEVMTVPIDDTLSISGEAADAKAVGDALELKADKTELEYHVKVNGEGADSQGNIIITADEIGMSDSDPTTTVKASIDTLSASMDGVDSATAAINNMTVSATGLAAGTESPTAEISDVNGHKHIAFGLIKGDKGDTGNTGVVPNITVGTVTTGAAGSSASVNRRAGSPDETPIFDYTIPKGDTGSTGATGATPELSIGTVVTGEPNTPASVTISGTAEAPVLNFTIPRGASGTIDDTAGTGDTDKTWSADKITAELTDKTEIDDTSGTGDTNKTWSADKLVGELLTKAPVIVDEATGDTTTASGAYLVLPGTIAGTEVGKFSIVLDPPVQDYNGYTRPWGPGKGKNIFDSATTVKYVNYWISPTGAKVSTSGWKCYAIPVTANSDYYISGLSMGNSAGTGTQATVSFYTGESGSTPTGFISQTELGISGNCGAAVTVPASATLTLLCFFTSRASNVQVEAGTTQTVYEPYKNICPIEQHRSVIVRVNKTPYTGAWTNYTVNIPTVTGMELFGYVLELQPDGSGLVTVNYAEIPHYSGEELPGYWYGNQNLYTDGTPNSGSQVVYELETPLTFAVTGITVTNGPIMMQGGENRIWTEFGTTAESGIGYAQYCIETKAYIDKKLAELN